MDLQQIIEQQLQTWQINCNVNHYLLDNINQDWLTANLDGKGRVIGSLFLHINNIRQFWLKNSNKLLGEDLKQGKEIEDNKLLLNKSLEKSDKAMLDFLSDILKTGVIKNYKPNPTVFLGQMLAHEAHHRGQIMQVIKYNKYPISKSVNFGLWTWNTRQ